jgi:hypothetical protein
VTLARALDAGVDGVLAGVSPLVLGAIEQLKREVPLHAVVPALTEEERLELEPGVEPLLRRRVSRAGSSAGVRMALTRFARPAALYGGDWATRLPVLVESELAGVPRRHLHGVVLDAWIADFALAAGNVRVFETFIRFVRSTRRCAAGIETHNLGALVRALPSWKVAPDYVVTPVNAGGLGMKPSPAEALEALRAASVHVVAKDVCAGSGVKLVEAARLAREHGAAGIAADLSELAEAGAELRALAA